MGAWTGAGCRVSSGGRGRRIGGFHFLVGRPGVDRPSLSPATAPVAVGLTGSSLRQDRAAEKKILLSIYRRGRWQKSAWRKVVETERVAIFVNDNGVGKRGGGRRRMLD